MSEKLEKEAMEKHERALDEFIESGALATNMCPDFLRDSYFEHGWDACANKAIDKEKFVEWLKAMESQCAKASFVEHTYDEVRQIIELGEFDLK